MPNSFFILIPIVFFADLIAIAVGLAYSARKAGKSVFQYYDPQPALSIVGAYCATVTVITFLIFLNETVNFVNAILYSLLFNSLNSAAGDDITCFLSAGPRWGVKPILTMTDKRMNREQTRNASSYTTGRRCRSGTRFVH